MLIADKIVSNSRLTVTSNDSDKEQYQPVSNMTAVPMNIQPATAEFTAVANGVYGQTYQAYTEINGFKIGDRITVSGSGDKYTVKGVNDWYNAVLPHLELVLFKEDN